MTGRPSEVLHLAPGALEPGRPADINIFHLENIQVPADFDHPAQLCKGFDYVLTAGEIAVKDDRWQNTGSGKILKRTEK